MTYTYAELKADIQSYIVYDEEDFVAQIPGFIRASEEAIWERIQVPNFKKAMTGSMTSGNRYLELPTDFLAPASLEITVSGSTVYLLNKDVEFLKEVFPSTTQAQPRFYALFDDNTLMIAPVPDQSYVCQLNFFYRPVSITAGAESGTTWLSLKAYFTLMYGALVEATNFLKRTSGVVDVMAPVYETRFMGGIEGLINLGEARARKDAYRSGEKRKPER